MRYSLALPILDCLFVPKKCVLFLNSPLSSEERWLNRWRRSCSRIYLCYLSEESEVSTIDARQNFELANGSVSGALTMEKNTGFKLFRQRWWAMFVKKITHSKRYKISLIAQLLMPCLFVMMSLITVRSFPKLTDEPSIELTPNMFNAKTYTAYYSASTQG